MYGEDYQRYLESDHWKTVRAQRLKIDENKCAFCHSEKELRVHHISYERVGHENVDYDLITLCKSCHERLHEIKKREDEISKQLASMFECEARNAINPIANKYREIDGERLANVVYELIGNGKHKNFASIVRAIRDSMLFRTGHTTVYPYTDVSSYTIATQKLKQMRKPKSERQWTFNT